MPEGAIRTDSDDCVGHEFVFAIGCGDDVRPAGTRAPAIYPVEQDAEASPDNLGVVRRTLVHDSRPRWLGSAAGQFGVRVCPHAGWVGRREELHAGTDEYRYVGHA